MANILRRPPWLLSEREATSETAYANRREFLRALGISSVGLAALLGGCTDGRAAQQGAALQAGPPSPRNLYPAKRNQAYADAGRPLTPESVAGSYNNFYEFTTDKARVKDLVGSFEVRPWEVRVDGLCAKPKTWNVDEIEKLGMEERIYRFRCVEAWAMVVPWTGVPLRRLLAAAEPKPEATHVRFVSFLRPEQAPGQKSQSWYPWPYYEGLRLDEAMSELTLAVTGIYGHRLPKQHGAPIRIITPWKYGYKSPKSIVQIEFVKGEPHTFWNDLEPKEYSFLSNVDPAVPHPRWSQASERMIDTGERRETLPFNGYGEQVARMYG